MQAIVMNTLTGAVSEYDNFPFQSITPTHAGSAVGLYTLGGDLDVTAPIVSRIKTPSALFDDSRKKRCEGVYFSLRGAGTGELTVYGRDAEYSYLFDLRASGVSRAKPGKGVSENYWAFGFSNPDGDDFKLDRIEANIVQSDSRRLG